ncbi:hypothetical protein DCMF_25475 [Candidatus Formimonas warabiya]|uniref:SAM-dependent methyltransferase n=1 Tax=Formimonas warabiya TaxID=1761012 RepID=A0A3G1L2L5_FORW1|nr:hypothetical protein DCMF_25475 [Candidatus Formimonas warabiya]
MSQRLAAVAARVPEGTVVADIGTDHGYLPAYLVMNGISPGAIAADAAEQPLAAAAQLIDLLGIHRKVDTRLGDGLQVLAPGEAETVCMAGMGSTTMINILEQAPHVLTQVRRLILQPMQGIPRMRIWLAKHGWRIIDEELVFEENTFYEIIAAEPGIMALSAEEAEVGPVLLLRSHPLLKRYLGEKITALEKIDASLCKSKSEETASKKREIGEKINMLKRVMECL